MDNSHCQFFSRSHACSGKSNDQIFPRCFNNFFGHSLKLVDLQDALHLHQQAVNQTNIASRDTNNLCYVEYSSSNII